MLSTEPTRLHWRHPRCKIEARVPKPRVTAGGPIIQAIHIRHINIHASPHRSAIDTTIHRVSIAELTRLMEASLIEANLGATTIIARVGASTIISSTAVEAGVVGC